MPFTGKATYSAGAALPEIAEDVSDLVAIVSPFETPLLDALGDPQTEAQSTHHEWLEDTLLPNTDTVTSTPTNPESDTEIEVDHADRFRTGDQVRCDDSDELLFVTEVGASTITVTKDLVDLYLLLFKEDVQTDLQCTEGREQMYTHEIR